MSELCSQESAAKSLIKVLKIGSQSPSTKPNNCDGHSKSEVNEEIDLDETKILSL